MYRNLAVWLNYSSSSMPIVLTSYYIKWKRRDRLSTNRPRTRRLRSVWKMGLHGWSVTCGALNTLNRGACQSTLLARHSGARRLLVDRSDIQSSQWKRTSVARTHVRDVHLRRLEALCSADTSRLVVSTIGSQVFSMARPQVWNNLPKDITNAPSLDVLGPFTYRYFNDGRYTDGSLGTRTVLTVCF